MAKPPSYFSFHPDRVGIIIFACDFFKLKSTAAPHGGISVELQQADRAASAVVLKNRTDFNRSFYAFFIPFFCS